MTSPATSPPPLPTPPIAPLTSPPPSSPAPETNPNPPPPPDPTPPPSSAPETPTLSPPPSPAALPPLPISPPRATPPLSPPSPPPLTPPPTESPTSQPPPETSPPPSSSPPLLPPPLPTSSPPPSPASILPIPSPPIVLTPPPAASAPLQPSPVVVVTPSPPISPHTPSPPPSKTPKEPTASSSSPPPATSLRPVPDPLIPSPATVASPPPPPRGAKYDGGGIPESSGKTPPPSSSSRNISSPNSGDGGGGERSLLVSSGLVEGLFAGVVVFVLLVVVSVLVVLCRKRRRRSGFEGGDESAGYGGLNYMRFEDRNLQAGQSKSNRPYLVSATSQNSGRSSDGSPPPMAAREANRSTTVVPSFGTFSYEELVAATDGFSESNLLGQGGFGYVYRGTIRNGKQVAVKQLRIGGKQGEREFQAEVEIISQVHHRNLVSLVGYCVAGADRMLVYEFVPNKTMEFHLHGEQPVMEWSTRMKIALGSAKGLAYLHEECNPTIIHRDIKAANILLDFNFEAKVSDFGLAKIFSSQDTSITHITTRVVGTFGYLAPEYASSGKVTDKSDVYSYGIVLLELIAGRPPISRPPISPAESSTDGSLVNWARPLLAQAIENGTLDGLVDPRLQNHYNLDEMHSMVHCAAACVRLSAWRRPRMSQVVRALEGDLSLLDLSSDGIRPNLGPSRFPYETSDSETYQHSEGMKLLRRALTSDGYGADGSRYSGTTSEYGLYPSASSINSQHARS